MERFMDDFEKELKIGFLEEASQALADVEQSFLTLEQDPSDRSVIDKIFRLAHNLKGSSRAVGFDSMGAFTHEFESLLLKMKEGTLQISPPIMNLMLRCNDHLVQMVDTLKGDLTAVVDSSDLISEIQAILSGHVNFDEPVMEIASEAELFEAPLAEAFSEEPAPEVAQEFSPSPELELQLDSKPEDVGVVPEIEIPVENEVTLHAVETVASAPENVDTREVSAQKKIEELSKKIEEAKKPETPKADVHKDTHKAGAAAQVDETIRVSTSRLEKLLNFVGEMVILQAVLREQSAESDSLLLKKTVNQLGKVTKEVQDISMSLRMVPVKPTFQKMQRIVRDTAGALGKKVQLHLIGEETELDKTVLERLTDPLVHLVRNAVDHGIENRETRLKNGKSEVGNVTLSAYHQSGKLVIDIRDDGGGIDAKKVIELARKKGLLRPNQEITDKEAYYLLFAPGFSTKQQITDISGRGVGMDVVKTNIEELTGEVLIETELGKGTVFRVVLPLTMAIIDGMILRSGDDRYVLPLGHVHECIRPKKEMVKNTTGMGEILMLRGENLPMYRLGALFGKKTASLDFNGISIVVRSGGEPYALYVDDIIAQYQVVVKQLGNELKTCRGVSGSTILGDGRPALIIEPNDLVKKDNKSSKSGMGRIAA